MTRPTMHVMLLIVVLACGGADPASETSGMCEGAGPSDGSGGARSEITADAAAEMTIAEMLGADSRFTQFHDLVSRTVSTGLNQSWLEIFDWPAVRMGDGRDGVTLFAPIDAAFKRLDPGLLAAIQDPDLDNEVRYSLLGHHYVHSLYPADEFEPGSQRTWRGRGTVELTLQPLTWSGCPVVQTDIRVSNGYIHVLDGIVVPPELQQIATG